MYGPPRLQASPYRICNLVKVTFRSWPEACDSGHMRARSMCDATCMVRSLGCVLSFTDVVRSVQEQLLSRSEPTYNLHGCGRYVDAGCLRLAMSFGHSVPSTCVGRFFG